MKTRIKTELEIEAMRQSGKILADCLAEATKMAKAGTTTAQIDKKVREMTLAAGGKPSFLGYDGFPAGICISVNEEIVHGIPGTRELQNGDIVGLDYGVTIDGMITDSAVTVPVGEISKEAQHLLDGTKRALNAGIDQVKDGIHVGEIGKAIEASLRRDGLSVIYNLGGHGVGHKVHEEPFIANFHTSSPGPVLRAGMTIAIEPNVAISTHEFYVAKDGWTCKTSDGSLSAQFEHTVLVTKNGYEILT